MAIETTEKEKSEMAKFAAKVQELQEQSHIRCEKWKSKMLKSSPILVFLVNEMNKIGSLDTTKIKCTPCDPSRAGGFLPGKGIALCENQLQSKSHLEDTLAHELIHAYDNATIDIDWSDPLHVACTEIRAANLSRECSFVREVKRGYLAFSGHHQECVFRRATLGVWQSGVVKSQEDAAKAVKYVWKSCFADTAPFDEIY